ncbi:MAG: winged helix-turn-helix domain-containing protein [Chloroflexales bacterium]|nr:winged helix-turn-helix domain-containing protein [Chloroflexales bacterium]
MSVYISYLRRKLNQIGQPNSIRTIHGVGYHLEANCV